MHARPDERLPAALFRMLEARTASAIAVFALDDGACRPWAVSTALAELWPKAEEGLSPTALQAISLARGNGGVARISPRALGLSGGFAAVAPVKGSGGATTGFLLALDRNPRRLTSGLAAALVDGATLVAPLLAAEGARTASPPRATPSAALGSREAQRVVEAARHCGTGPFALMMLDLDRFRVVNEALGLAAGEALLAMTATRLERALRPADRLVRLEGDRFVILAAPEQSDLRALARRLLHAVSQPLELAGRTVAVQASAGIAAGSPPGLPTASLLLQAESALARAKTEGGNRFVMHEPRLEAAALEKSRLELDLARALGDGQLHMVYQPYVSLADGAVSGVEALLRWRHPSRGELQPASFIAMAEATGLILPIGAWALRTAVARAARWPSALAIAVNISALQFQQPNFVAEVDAALAAARVAPERLELEITETVLMRDNPETARRLAALIDRGVRIALDDFGTGYSALAYLARLPHHRIKLDKVFVQDLANPATAELIRAIVALARAREVAITAEGVERPDLLAKVRRLGFTHAQGYATGAPVAEPTVLAAAPLAVPVG